MSLRRICFESIFTMKVNRVWVAFVFGLILCSEGTLLAQKPKQTKPTKQTKQSAAPALTDPELKQLGTALAKTFNDQAEAIESTYKGLKNAKKDAK